MITLLSRAASDWFCPGLWWETKQYASSAMFSLSGGKAEISATDTAQEGSAASGKVLGNSSVLILKKNLLIIPPGQILPSALWWGDGTGYWISSVTVWHGGAHPAPALPRSPQQHPRCHGTAANPATAPAASSPQLLSTISQGLHPLQCCGSARKANSLMQPAPMAPGGMSSAE